MDDYQQVIDRVYIKPIRSVIALDDQFPTLDKLLDPAVSPVEARTTGGHTASFVAVPVNPDEIGKAKSLVSYCRKRQWMVDIHDGSKVLPAEGDGVLEHLHQTDLLVLDYKLEGETFSGDRAIKILRALAENPHFNIVIVYTKDDVVGTFREIALSLLSPADFPGDRSDEVADVWADWNQDDAAGTAALREQIDANVYLYARRPGPAPQWRDFKAAFPSVKSFSDLVNAKIRNRAGCTLTAEHFGRWLLKDQQNQIQAKLYGAGVSSISVIRSAGENLNWLRTDNLFLTVISKDIEGKPVIDRLHQALCDWRPSPHRLILSSLRAELEDRGGSIEEAALGDDRLQAGLLKQLLKSDGKARTTRLARILEQHWSETLRVMKAEVLPGAEQVIAVESALAAGDVDKAIARHYDWYNSGDGQQKSDMALSVNAYVSTQPVEGHHLTTGHIFEFENAHWICLSPICDLETSQNEEKRWRAHLGDALPFKAVKLEKIEPNTAVKYATSSLCLFLKLAGEYRCFGFVNVGGKLGELNPHWEQMFAAGQGKCTASHEIQVQAVRLEQAAPRLSAPQTVQIVAQLKYEYALNLLQRLGSNLSRVGLDYVTSL